MKRKWKLSRYTSIINDPDSGDVLLHNSYMGAIARIPEHRNSGIQKFFQWPSEKHSKNWSESEFEEPGPSQRDLRELCEQGFFVASDLDEREIVSNILNRERMTGFGLIILPHENCNFRCSYCYESFDRGKMKPNTVAGLKAFVDQKVQEVRDLSIAWFGGEPLLARDIICELSDSFIRSCEKSGVRYSSNITTNGYLLTPTVVDSLLKRRVSRYQVTLDGPKSIHNSRRKLAGGGKTFGKILDNLTSMHRRPGEFHVRIRTNFDNETVVYMEQFLEDLGTLFKDDPRFTLGFHPVGRWGGPNDSDLDTCDPIAAQTVSLGLIENALELGFPDAMTKDPLRPHGTVCYASKETSIVVRSDGTLCKCTVALDDPRNDVGKLTEDGDLVVDQASLDLWTKLDDKSTAKCDSCWFAPSCQGRACPLSAINQGEPPCPITLTEYESRVRLVALTAQSDSEP
jgi:uncharacterized protein